MSSNLWQTILKTWRWLIHPKIPYEDVAVQHKSRLLAVFLLIMVLVFSGVDIAYSLTIPDYQVPWMGYGMMIIAFLLNRNQRYAWAARLTIAMFPMVIFSTIFGGTAADPIVTLNYSVLAIILGSIFLAKEGVIVLTLVNTIGIILVPVFAPDLLIKPGAIIGPLSSTLIGGALLVIFMQHRNVVERDRQAALRESEMNLRNLFNQVPVSIWVEDFSEVKQLLNKLRDQGIDDLRLYFDNHPEFVQHCASQVNIVDVNAATLELFGADSKDGILKNLDAIFTDESYEAFQEELIGLYEGKNIIEIETINKRLDDQPIIVDVKLSVVPGHEDTWDQILISLTDITVRKKVEEKIAKSEHSLRRAQEIAHVGSWIWHTGTNEMEMSDELFNIIGRKKEEGVPPVDVEAKMIHPDDREHVLEAITIARLST